MKRKYGKRKYRKYKKIYRRAKKRYRRRNKASKVTMPDTIVSDRALTKLRYTEEISIIQPSAGVPYVHFFNGNSLYDPNGTGSGTQPQGFDQWALFFNRYKVYGCKMKVQFLSISGTAATANFYTCLVPSSVPINSAPATSMDEYAMLPYAQSKIFNQNAPWIATLNGYMSTEKILGLNKKAAEIETTLSATIGNNPARLWYWNVAVKGVGGNFASTVMRVHMTYYCEFFDRVVNDGS